MMRLVKQNALLSWTILKEYREMLPSEYVEWSSEQQAAAGTLRIFISHRWISPNHPDPSGEQLHEVQNRMRALHNHDALVFYDYCSMLQRPRTASEDLIFYRDIDSLTSLLRSVDIVIILSEGYTDYKNRAWCFFEAIGSEGRVQYFDDQGDIRRDLAFLGGLLYEKQFTSWDFSYKTDLIEAEIIVAALQHLNHCNVTHADDFPRIKSQMIRFFNERRLTPFGRLVTGICKYFDVTFAVWPDGGVAEALACTPYFEEPEWERLQLGGRSIFAIPPALAETAGRILDRLLPIVRLALSGVEDQRAFLEAFQRDHDWPRYVVSPLALGLQGDRFPSLAHVIHTALERPPGLFYSPDSKYAYFPLWRSDSE